MDKFVFHYHETSGNEVRMAPSAYYLDNDYSIIAVRIYAEIAPIRDAKIDIFDDGVSIFGNRADDYVNIVTGVRTIPDAVTTAVLSAGENAAEIASVDFVNEMIEGDSWIHCNLVDAGGEVTSR